MNLDLDYKLRLVSEQTLTDGPVESDKDFDATYEVAFHMDDLDAVYDITHELDPIQYHPDVVSRVPVDDIAEVEDQLRSWLESRSADGSLLVDPGMIYDVAFQITPKGIKFRHLAGATNAS